MKENLKTTTNNRVYNRLKKRNLDSKHGLCRYCSLHSGCNYWYRSEQPNRNWKYWRKTQYKVVKNRNSEKNENENEI